MTTLCVRATSLEAPIPDTTVLGLIASAFPYLSALGIDMNAEGVDKLSTSPACTLTPNLIFFINSNGSPSNIQPRLEELQCARRRERNRIRSEYQMPELKQEEDDDELYDEDASALFEVSYDEGDEDESD
ncbi:hypothetical protein CVT24_001005 [Panaeolus cyanescens]|uniref:Uncharacterized protein n=1 Tax=Panaeolus cyanescens TaxID=181874 RepID=A0A409YCH3_9AGAR|nr:hypothetical protein CVT24_001005 [Panaeolus cyanescens]